MKLVCQKYNETMSSDTAVCRHSREYCKFRGSCIIQFEERERRLAERGSASEDNRKQEPCGCLTGK